MSEGVYDENGETVEVVFTDINDDGSKQVRRYDNNFELIEKVDYDTNGNPIT